MRWERLLRKELREILRDRRTIVTLILMPLLLYPLLGTAFRQFFLTNLTTTTPIPYYKLGFASNEEAVFIQFCFGLVDSLRKTENQPAPKLSNTPIKYQVYTDPVAALRQGDIDLAILIPNVPSVPPPLDRPLAVDVEISHVAQSAVGQQVLHELDKRLDLANQEFLKLRLDTLRGQLPPGQRSVWRQRPSPVASQVTAIEVKQPSVTLAALIPVILILMTMTGAVYPAIDLTAGERERGTLEVLMAAPIPRMSLLFAKYVAVLTVATLTALVNLVMMTATLMASGLGRLLLGETGMSLPLVLKVLGLLLLFVSFFSAILLTVASFARSFKEAQAYLIPLTLLSLAPGLLTIVPGIEFSRTLAVTPVINMALLSRDLFEGHAAPEMAAIAIVATLVYGLASLALAAQVFGAEAVLYSEQASWSDLFRRPPEPRPVPTLSNALLCLALLMPAYFLLSGFLSLWKGDSLGPSILFMGLANFALFGAFPICAALLSHVRLATGLQCKPPTIWALLAAAFLGLSLWPLIHELGLVMRSLGWVGAKVQHEAMVDKMVQQWRELPLSWILAALAVSPAVCEELMFRGYLFSALRSRGPLVAIGVSAVLFGLFHTVMSEIFSVERLLPTTLLGVVLGWVCWQTGSVFPGMVVHALHNACLITVAYYAEEFRRDLYPSGPDGHLQLGCYLASAAGITLGLALLILTPPPRAADTCIKGDYV